MSVSNGNQRRKGRVSGLFFVCVSDIIFRHKKVGVPADLDLVSTVRKMRGLEKPPPSD